MTIAFGSTCILRGATQAITGEPYIVEAPSRVFQAILDGAGEATVAIDVSADGKHFLELASISLTNAQAGSTSDGFASPAPWRFIRARLVSVTAGAALTAYVGS